MHLCFITDRFYRYTLLIKTLVLTRELQIEEELKQNRERFSDSQELIVSVHTWNVEGSKHIKEGDRFPEWIHPMKDLKTPDIYIIGLEEIVKLNAKNIMFCSNSKNIELWKNLLQANLNEIDTYIILL